MKKNTTQSIVMPDEVTLKDAANEQVSLAARVVMEDDPPFDNSIITGVDVHYRGSLAFGCATVMDAKTLEPIQTVTLNKEVEFDYIPGFLYLREGPIVLDLLKQLDESGPVLIDGNGILHPRRLGLASYVGVVMDIQTIGVAKRLHIGTISPRIESEAQILENDDVIGTAVWLGKENPVFVSIGNKITLSTSVEVVRTCSINGHPEPLRYAHKTAKNLALRK